MTAVWGTSSNDVWAFSTTGRVVHWNGGAWVEHAGIAPPADGVTGLSIAAWNDVWAASVQGSQLRHWNGYAWQPVITGVVPSARTVVSVTAGHGRVLMSNGTVLTRTP
jgi:hypothetical protein